MFRTLRFLCHVSCCTSAIQITHCSDVVTWFAYIYRNKYRPAFLLIESSQLSSTKIFKCRNKYLRFTSIYSTVFLNVTNCLPRRLQMSSLIRSTVLKVFSYSTQYLLFFSQYLQMPSSVPSIVLVIDFNSNQYLIPFPYAFKSPPQYLQLPFLSKYIQMSSSLLSSYLLRRF